MRTINLPTIGNKLATYAWPGGYPIFYLDGENNCLCPKCANESRAKYVEDVLGEMCAWCLGEEVYTSWCMSSKELPIAADANWEDPHLYCDNCNQRIESAYADDDDDTMQLND